VNSHFGANYYIHYVRYFVISMIDITGESGLHRKKLTSTLTNLTSKTVTSNLTSTFLTSTVKRGQTGGQTGSPVGWVGGGVTADDDRGCYDPV